jgi:hypothetical protein
MFGLLAFVIVVLDVLALATIVQSSMTIAMKVLWALIVVVVPVGGIPLYVAFGPKH